MKIKKLNDINEWDNFIENSNNGTIFHKLKFLSYHSPRKFRFTNLAIYNNAELLAVIPGGIDNGVYKSPMGASYGSIITKDLSFNDYEELINVFLTYIGSKAKKIQLIPPPIIYMKNPHQMDSFILEYKGFNTQFNLITNATNLENFNSSKEIIKTVQKRFRGDINVSLRANISVKIDTNIEAFYRLLIENKKKFDAKPTHSLEELKRLMYLFPDDIKLFMAYDNKIPVAGVMLFVANKKTVLVFYICQDYTYQKNRAVSRLLYEALLWSKKNGYTWFDLGVSMDTFSSNPMEPSRNLIFFKEGINSKGFLRTMYTYNYE